LKQFNITSIN